MLNCKIINLSHRLNSHIPTWEGGCGFNCHTMLDYSQCEGKYKFKVKAINMYAGAGTHMDAPSHCFEGGKNTQDFTTQQLFMPCVVVDVEYKCHPTYYINIQDLQNFENMHGPIPPNCCVLIKTGWSKFWKEPQRYVNGHVFPAILPEVANFLLEKKVFALGVDTLSPDRPESGFEVHKLFLGAGKILIENVANLHKMPPRGAHLLIAPLNMEQATEAPISLIAFIKKNSPTP